MKLNKNETEDYTIQIRRINDSLRFSKSTSERITKYTMIINGKVCNEKIIPRHKGTMKIEVLF